MQGGEVACLDFVAEREGKRPPGRPRHRGKDSIKTLLKRGLNGMEKTPLAQYGTYWNLLSKLKIILLP
jgi:hypothetical protein